VVASRINWPYVPTVYRVGTRSGHSECSGPQTEHVSPPGPFRMYPAGPPSVHRSGSFRMFRAVNRAGFLPRYIVGTLRMSQAGPLQVHRLGTFRMFRGFPHPVHFGNTATRFRHRSSLSGQRRVSVPPSGSHRCLCSCLFSLHCTYCRIHDSEI